MKIIKIISIGVMGTLSSLAVAGYGARFFAGGDLDAAFLALLFVALFLVMATLETFLIKRFGVLLLLAFLQSAGPLALFVEKIKDPGGGRKLIFFAAGILFLLQIIGMKEGRAVLENSLKIKAMQTAKAVMPKITTGLILFMSILFYLTYFTWGGWNDAVGRRISDKVWQGINPILRIWVEGANTNQTADEFLRAVTEAEIRKMKTKAAQERSAEFDLDLLAPEERESRIEEIVQRVKTEIERISGTFDGNEKMSEVVYRTLKKQAESVGLASKNLGKFAGIALALIVFGFLRSLAFLVNWIAELVAVGALKLLLAAGFAEVKFESASREKIEL